MSRGLFITVEGTEGVGKSSNIAFIETTLKAAGKDVVMTREPGGTPVSEHIRDLLLDAKQQSMVDEFDSQLAL